MNNYTVDELVNVLNAWIDDWTEKEMLKTFYADLAYTYLSGYAPDAKMADCHEAVKRLLDVDKLKLPNAFI